MAALDFAALLSHERQRRKTKKAAVKQVESEVLGLHRPAPSLALLDREGAPSTLKYCNNFLSTDEANHLEAIIRKEHGKGEWLTLPKRKLLNLGGVPHPDGMIAEELPAWVREMLVPRLQAVGAFPADVLPDQVLLNEYGPGQGIDPHTDGPLFAPVVAIVSLASSALLHFLEPPDNIDGTSGTRGYGWAELGPSVASVALMPGSLLVFSDHAYKHLWHGVPDLHEERISEHTLNSKEAGLELGAVVPRGRRLSFTIRAVQRVAVPAGHFWDEMQRVEARRRRGWWAQAVSERSELHKEKSAGLRPTAIEWPAVACDEKQKSHKEISDAAEVCLEKEMKQSSASLPWIETLKLPDASEHLPMKLEWPES
mmetsp:Transcript_42274/g.75698  ORF Transcript_42274/g.75698 Transcript_42274/m.75698 type:complete len:369 (-) Transcript_42274:80-1186(-)